MIRKAIVGVMIVGLVGSAGAASNDAGTTAGTMLRLGAGARGRAMGDAMTANSIGVSAMYYNPADVGFTNRAEAEAMYQSLVADIGLGQVGFVHPINSVSTWGVGVSYLDYGKSTRVSLADIINNNQPATTFTGQDIAVRGTYGRRFSDAFAGGLTLKVLNQEIDNQSATAFAADVGLSIRPQSWPVRFGVTGQNLGSKIKFDSERNSLPTLVRAGLALDLFEDRLTISADAEKVRDQDVTGQVGAEFRLMQMLAFRVGFDGRIDADDGWTAGMGVKVSDLSFDYAFVPYGHLGNTHRVSLTYQFGPKY
jgi:hypothetical protein